MPTTSNFGWTTPADTDLVKDGAAAIRTLGNGIDTSFLDLKGGTTGQVLSKASNTDLDFSWVAQDDSNAIQNAIVDAKGDLISATAADTPARLAVGANGTVLTADSAEATGLKWAAPAGGGKLLQMVTATVTTDTSITSTTFTDTNITATITPTSNTSKILIMINMLVFTARSTNSAINDARILRGATTVTDFGNVSFFNGLSATGATGVERHDNKTIHFVDSPASTSALTYKLQARVNTAANSNTIRFQPDSSVSSITLLEIGA